MKQKAIRKIFAILALIAIFASLIWVWITYLLAPKVPVKTKQQAEQENILKNIKMQNIKLETKDSNKNVKISVNKKEEKSTEKTKKEKK